MSKFRDVIDSHKGREPAPDEAPTNPPAPVAAPPAAHPGAEAGSPRPAEAPPPLPPEAPAPRKPGRPPGKRSDPGFVQVTAYVPGDLHHAVKLALLQERQGREFSELVADLLSEWLSHRTSE